MYDPEMSVYLKLSTCLTEFDCENAYVVQMGGKILPSSGVKEEEIGSVAVNLCRLGLAWNDKMPVFDVLDAYSETAPPIWSPLEKAASGGPGRWNGFVPPRDYVTCS